MAVLSNFAMFSMIKKFLINLAKNPPRNDEELESAKRLFLRADKQLSPSQRGLSKKDLLALYHKLLAKNKVKKSPALERLLTKRAVRTLSGVAIITVLTKPWACPGRCVYCPSEPGMPKSYLSDEPAAARAKMLKFDPYEQTRQRILALEANGHPTDKIELIIKGGSWSAYPLAYQHWFILRCFQAANGRIRNKKSGIKKIDALKKTLAEEQRKNELSKHRIVGLTLETRPDFITEKTAAEMREVGCTRVEMGAQTTDDKILKLIKRGHDARQTKTATRLLKNHGFKVDYHLMPQLPGSTPAKDLKMMEEIFSDPDYRPDMLKIYPCTVIENSLLYDWLKKGRYKPYPDKQLIATLIKFKTRIPGYARVSRLIRDIPGHHVKAGNKMTNLRQVIQARMRAEGLKCRCLRCREIGHNEELGTKNKELRVKLFIDKYKASGGTEYFLSYEDVKRNVVYAFCRLRILPPLYKGRVREGYRAFIRELHTYGHLVGIGKNEKKASQHTGLGKKLLAEAEKICAKNKVQKLAIIAGVGVRNYYRKLGYRLENTYMVKKLRK
ncbi:tRNA uridine(34) 5-carboxymethylaminomethyl modification radical SAM/GNAT enzyme Elp3 [Patescibacteria group bacterium]|nr:MAG: tRNA uridine(34) 5-carboxymethylaminomethyl modification radical SAM/GNAT enzyme Elp3 [Patescibacteria group bacterium]